MSIISKIIKKIFSSRLPYVQVLCVFLAFTLMTVASFLMGVNIERQHLEKDAEFLAEQIEERLTTNLHELKTFLGVVSETIRAMLLRDVDFEEIKNYITDIINYGLYENGGITGFSGIFAMFDILDRAGMNGLVPNPDWERKMPDYVPQERPWYIAAEKSNGEIVETNPYVDALSQEVSITYVRCIYDNNGARLAIICLDVLLDRINEISTKHHKLGIHSWMMLDRNFTIISYPFKEFIGKKVREAKGSGIEDIADSLEQGLPVLSHRFVNPAGETKIYSVRQTRHGWYIGVSTPEDVYYANINSILWFLIAFGLLMSLGLSSILLHIVAQKNKIEKRTQIMLDSAPFSVNFFDKNFNVVECNLAALKMFDIYDKEEYKSNFFCYSPMYQPNGMLSAELQNKYLEKVSKEGRNQFEWMHQKSNGEMLPVDVTIISSTYEEKDISIAYIRDLRETRAVIEEKNKAEESSRYKSTFLANMSHEIRTPMNAILGIAEIQLQNKDIPWNFEEAFSKIYESGDLLLNIINDILDISKIETGKLELVPIKYDIPSLINDTVQLNCLRYDSKPIDFNLQIDENTPHNLFGDELRIKQVLNNILSNAFKYTDKGKIKLSVSALDAADEDVTIVFTVSDTGQGMTEEQIAVLFDEYTRFNVEANRGTVGTGLGMTITKCLVDLMNGSISVQSEVGNGSVFTVHIPQKRTDMSVCGAEIADKLRNFRFQSMAIARKTQFIREYMPYGSVLVVDDVVSNIYVAKGMLLPYGLKIDTASSGFEAIQKIEEGSVYDIVFMDHMMPKMDGIEAVKIIRGMGYMHAIIALTANALIGQEKVFLDNGFDDFISKPIDSREMNYILNKFIRNKKSPEVVGAAQPVQYESEYTSAGTPAQQTVQKASIDEDLIMAVVKDINNALVVLEELLPEIETGNVDLTLYITTVHGMKSALANIGEKELSDVALRLEHAGDNKDLYIILTETPGFISLLRLFLKEIRRPKTGSSGDGSKDISHDDMVFLRSKLNSVCL